MWFAGQQVPGDAVLWFMSVRWWARAGKIATFVGGATVILDLIGPDRLRTIGERVVGSHQKLKSFARTTLNATYFTVGFPMTVGTLLIVVNGPGDRPWMTAYTIGVSVLVTLNIVIHGAWHGPKWIVRILVNERPAQAFRHLGLIVLFVGFHFDLLAS